MRVLVTGATGFVGAAIVKELLTTGCEVIATSSNLNSAKQHNWFDQVEYIPLDLKEEHPNLFHFLNNPDVVIHSAWMGLPDYQSNIHADQLNYHKQFIENLVAHGLKQLTILGTCQEYGYVDGELKEEMITEPHTKYAQAKDELRKYAEWLQKSNSFSLNWLRLFYLKGIRSGTSNIFSQIVKTVEEGADTFNMSSGEQMRDYLPLGEAASLIVRVALKNENSGVVNICSSQPIAMKDIVLSFLKERNYHIQLNLGFYPLPDYEPMNFWGSTAKLNRILQHE